MRHIFNICFLFIVTTCFGQCYEDDIVYELQIDIKPSFIEQARITIKQFKDSTSSITIKNYYFNEERIIDNSNLIKLDNLLDTYKFNHSNSTRTDTTISNGDTTVIEIIGSDGATVAGVYKKDEKINSFSFWSPSRESKNGEFMFSVFKVLDASFKEKRVKRYLNGLKSHFGGYTTELSNEAHKEFMIRTDVHMVVEKMPEFVGGVDSLNEYINTKLQTNDITSSANIKGKVYISFIIDEQGKVTNPEILKSLSSDIDMECLKIIANMPDWIPGVQYGNKVKVSYRIPIKFEENE